MEGVLQFINSLDGFMPGISLDCVLLGYRDQSLQVLLLKWKNVEAWTLPGGFLKQDEVLEEAVHRVLLERTGLENIFLTQFHTFSGLDRQLKDDTLYEHTLTPLYEGLTEPLKEKLSTWFSQRFITTGFLALVDINKTKLVPDYLSEKCEWVPINQLPPLLLDHELIVQKALRQLKIEVNYLPVGKSLLPEKFTMKELRFLFESILQKKLDRGNFQRKIRSLNILKRHEKLMTGAANKAPYLYSFEESAYHKLLEDGIGFSSL